jgi:hypothetical protein
MNFLTFNCFYWIFANLTISNELFKNELVLLYPMKYEIIDRFCYHALFIFLTFNCFYGMFGHLTISNELFKNEQVLLYRISNELFK